MKRLVTQLGRYFVVALVGLAVDFGLLVGLTEVANLPYLLSAVCGFAGGLIVNFLLSEVWVFDAPRIRSRAFRFGIYAGIGLVGLALLAVLMWIQVDLWAWNYLLAKVLATGVVYAWNFIARRTMYSA